MHILILPSEIFMTKLNPLGGIFQLHQARALEKSGHQVGIIAVSYISSRFLLKRNNYPLKEMLDGIIIYRKYVKMLFPVRITGLKYRKERLVRLIEPLIKDYIINHGIPDIIHAHNFVYAGFIANEIKRKFNIPFIVTEHSSQFAQGFIKNNMDNEIVQCAKNASIITAVSLPFCLLLNKRFGIDVLLLPNIVDDSFSVKLKNKNKNQFIFLNIARLDNNKNHQFLINSFARYFKNTNTLLKIGGDGALFNQLQELARSLGIIKQVIFLGELSQNEVENEMNNANCFVLTSNYETFGVVLIEALACGIPVIATKCGGPEDIVNEDNGLLIDCGDEEKLGEAMMYMFNNTNKYDANKLSDTTKKKYGESAFLAKVIDYYKKALEK